MFTKGHKLAPGGKREGAGRKSKAMKKELVKAEVIAKAYIEKHIKPVLETYLKLAQGRWVTRHTEDGGTYQDFVIDGPTTRHFIDKLVPARAVVDEKGHSVPAVVEHNVTEG